MVKYDKHKTMAERIKAAREYLNLTLEEFGALAGVSSTAAWKWENGGEIADEKLKLIADKTGTTMAELRYGLSSNVADGPQFKGKVPLISWVRAGQLCDDSCNSQTAVIEPEAWYGCPVPHGENTYVLKVVGPSMDTGDKDGYSDGDLIFVDPERSPQHNDDVVARTSDGKTTFKRLQLTPDGNHLIALNQDWKPRIINVSEDTIICGVVIFSGKDRR